MGPPPSILQLTLLGNGYLGSPKSVVVRSERQVYIFNCGEGTQRSLVEFSGGVGKIENLFFTGNTWDHVGGSVGMFLTLKDSNSTNVCFHGPKNVGNLIPFFRGCEFDAGVQTVDNITFSAMTEGRIVEGGCKEDDGRDEDGSWTDDEVIIRCIPLVAQSKSDLDASILNIDSPLVNGRHRPSNGPSTSENSCNNETDVPPDRRYAEQTCRNGASTTKDAESFAYVIDPVPLKPKLDMFKAMQLKIPRGPMLGKLVDGQSVTLDCGRVVSPDEVTLPAATCGSVAIVDVGSKDLLPALKRQSAWSRLNRPAVVVHLTPDHILQDEEYVEWACSLEEVVTKNLNDNADASATSRQPAVLHLLCSPSGRGFPSFAMYRQQFKLNRIHTDFFPLLPLQKSYADSTSSLSSSSSSPSSSSSEFASSFSPASILCKPGFHMMIRPPEESSLLKSGAPRTPKLIYDEELFLKEIEENSEDLDEAMVQMRKAAEQLGLEGRGGESQWPQVVFLGTTSAIPKKERNVSGILVRRSEEESFILDCGEGTTVQLKRRFGGDADAILRTIGLIFISHNHTDHHIGLPGLIQARQRAFEAIEKEEPPLYLILPSKIAEWLVKFNKDIVRILDKVEIITSQSVYYGEFPLESMADLKRQTKLRSIDVCYVHHCFQAFGVSITDEGGWKLTFSGDTVPCKNLVKLGMNSDLLIHEATMEDGWEAEALKKKHSTASQAIQIGKEMKAKLVILTHFSGRYKMIPLPEDQDLTNVGLAFDHATFSFLRDAKLIPLVIKPLQSLFAKYLEEEQEKAVKRQLRIEDELEAKRLRWVSEEREIGEGTVGGKEGGERAVEKGVEARGKKKGVPTPIAEGKRKQGGGKAKKDKNKKLELEGTNVSDTQAQ